MSLLLLFAGVSGVGVPPVTPTYTARPARPFLDADQFALELLRDEEDALIAALILRHRARP